VISRRERPALHKGEIVTSKYYYNLAGAHMNILCTSRRTRACWRTRITSNLPLTRLYSTLNSHPDTFVQNPLNENSDVSFVQSCT
jgi:hypothetical protein